MTSAPTALPIPRLPWVGSLPSRVAMRLVRLFARPRCSETLLADVPGRIEELLHFGRETDRDFTGMAVGLGEITSQLDRMRTRAGILEGILEDRDQDRALSSTHDLCKSAIELVHASLGTSHSLHARMSEADAALMLAVAAREDFEKNFVMLRTLSMGIRIEAARSSPEFRGVFAQVAGAIQAIDEKIATSTARAFDRMQALLRETTVDRAGTAREEAALYQQAKESIDLVQRDIDALRQALAPCSRALQDVSRLLDTTAAPRLSILSSLQYQDIVRQKLEHVATGFRDMIQHSDDPVFLHRAAQLQQTHLAGARGEIATAGSTATEGLDTLLQIGGAIDAILQNVEANAVAAFGRSSMDEIVERELIHLAQIASTSAETNRRIAARVERIETVVREFSGGVAAHQREVKLVALNAQIAAARLTAGGALEKLAEEASHVAQRNAETTRRLTEHLQVTLERLVHTKREADVFMEAMGRDKVTLEAGASSVGEKLIRHRRTIQKHSHEVRTEFARVQENIRGLLAGTRFPMLIDGCFGPAESLCHDLATRTRRALDTASLSDSGARRFRDHLRRYTMENERSAHAAVLGGLALAAGSSATGAIDTPTSIAPDANVPVAPDPDPFPVPDAFAREETPVSTLPSHVAAATSTSRPSETPGTETNPDLGDGIELF